MAMSQLLTLPLLLLAAHVLADEWTPVDHAAGSLGSNGLKAERSPLAYKLGHLSAGFQPSIRMSTGRDGLSYLNPFLYATINPRILGTSDQSRKRSLFYQVNVQFQLQDGTYLGIQNLFTQRDNTLGSGSYGVYQDFYLEVPGCGKQRFNRNLSAQPTGYSIHVTGSESLLYLEATWTFTSYASSSCPPVFAGLFFVTDQEDLTPYFTTSWKVIGADQYKRRRRAAVDMMVAMVDPPVMECFAGDAVPLFNF